jgi:hypothetical protein
MVLYYEYFPEGRKVSYDIPLYLLGKSSSTHWIGGWMGSRVSLDAVKKNTHPYRDINSFLVIHPVV